MCTRNNLQNNVKFYVEPILKLREVLEKNTYLDARIIFSIDDDWRNRNDACMVCRKIQ